MASISTISTKAVFRLDSGEVKNGKPVFRSVTIGRIDNGIEAASLAPVVEEFQDLLQFETDRVTLSRVELLEL
jgi:hypothetical protein